MHSVDIYADRPGLNATTSGPQRQPPSGHARQGAPPARAGWRRSARSVRADNPRAAHGDDQSRVAAEALRLP